MLKISTSLTIPTIPLILECLVVISLSFYHLMVYFWAHFGHDTDYGTYLVCYYITTHLLRVLFWSKNSSLVLLSSMFLSLSSLEQTILYSQPLIISRLYKLAWLKLLSSHPEIPKILISIPS